MTDTSRRSAAYADVLRNYIFASVFRDWYLKSDFVTCRFIDVQLYGKVRAHFILRDLKHGDTDASCQRHRS